MPRYSFGCAASQPRETSERPPPPAPSSTGAGGETNPPTIQPLKATPDCLIVPCQLDYAKVSLIETTRKAGNAVTPGVVGVRLEPAIRCYPVREIGRAHV